MGDMGLARSKVQLWLKSDLGTHANIIIKILYRSVF